MISEFPPPFFFFHSFTLIVLYLFPVYSVLVLLGSGRNISCRASEHRERQRELELV